MNQTNDCAVADPDTSCLQLLSLAVHECRTPAGVIAGYLRMLRVHTVPPLSPHQRQLIDAAERSCQRLVAIVAELSDIGRIDAGELTLACEPFDAWEMIDEAAQAVRASNAGAAHLEVRGTQRGPVLRGDVVRLRSAVQAVLRAVVRETSPRATVVADRHLVTDAHGRVSVVLVIAESGDVQHAAEAPQAAFDEDRCGLGLALPLARRVIELHGGRIRSPGPERKRWTLDAVRKSPPTLAAVIALPIER